MGKEKKQYWRGYKHGQKERKSPTNPIAAVLTGSRYKPPSRSQGEREAYKAGFRRGHKKK